MKTKAKVIFLNIITFGYFNHCLKKKINQQNQSNNQDNQLSNLKTSNKVPFKIDLLVDYLGGKENIKSLNNSINTLQVYFVDKQKIKIDEIKLLGAKGTSINNDKISIIFGDYAPALKEQLEILIGN